KGTGKIQIEAAINTKTIIHDPLLSFGKIDPYKETNTIEMKIENTTNEQQKYTFDITKKATGLAWKLPQPVTAKQKETTTIPVELSVRTAQVKKGIHEGWLTLHQGEEVYQLPYLFVNKTADYPKAMGFEFSLKTFADDTYTYRLYVTEPV